MAFIQVRSSMTDADDSDAQFKTAAGRMLRREALRRAAMEMSTTSGPGLENMLERISREVTAEAAAKLPHGPLSGE